MNWRLRARIDYFRVSPPINKSCVIRVINNELTACGVCRSVGLFANEILELHCPYDRLGELFDLEKLSEVCAETGRYTFFFSSWPLHMYALSYDSLSLLTARQ